MICFHLKHPYLKQIRIHFRCFSHQHLHVRKGDFIDRIEGWFILENFFDEILQPISTSTSKSTVPLVTNNPVVTKPLQSGDLNSSLTQLIDNLDIKDHSKIG